MSLERERGLYERGEEYNLPTEDHTKHVSYKKRSVSYRTPLILFIATIITTILAGALQQGVNPLQEPWKVYKGLPFSMTLLAILMTHEMGHFLASKRHGVDATLPYFIPAPTFLGTLGAVIKMRSPILNKNALIDIGASGPLAGFAVSIIAVFFGLKLSSVTAEGLETGIKLGAPLIFQIVSYLSIGSLPENYTILLHPMAFAGWIGFLVTALNLIPIGQLDGGHIVYAVMGRMHRTVSITMFLFLILFGIYGWPGWLIWAIIITILGTRHPPIMDESHSLDRVRKMVGWGALLVFILTFTPMPLS